MALDLPTILAGVAIVISVLSVLYTRQQAVETKRTRKITEAGRHDQLTPVFSLLLEPLNSGPAEEQVMRLTAKLEGPIGLERLDQLVIEVQCRTIATGLRWARVPQGSRSSRRSGDHIDSHQVLTARPAMDVEWSPSLLNGQRRRYHEESRSACRWSGLGHLTGMPVEIRGGARSSCRKSREATARVPPGSALLGCAARSCGQRLVSQRQVRIAAPGAVRRILLRTR
jgi:hypothetical protein